MRLCVFARLQHHATSRRVELYDGANASTATRSKPHLRAATRTLARSKNPWACSFQPHRPAMRGSQRGLIVAAALILLSVLFAIAAGAPTDTIRIPGFRVRARVLMVNGIGVTAQKFAIRVAVGRIPVKAFGPGQNQAAWVQGSAWSGWLAFGAPQSSEIERKLPPSAYAAHSAVPVNVYISRMAVPAVAEAEVQFDQGSPLTVRESLIGPNLGLMVWSDEAGRPHASSMADFNRRYWAQMNGINLALGERPKQFTIIDRFVAGDDDARDWSEGLTNLARAGANALALPPSSDLRALLLKTGLHRTAWAVYAPPGYALGLTPYVNDATLPAWAQKLAAQFYKAGYGSRDMAAY